MDRRPDLVMEQLPLRGESTVIRRRWGPSPRRRHLNLQRKEWRPIAAPYVDFLESLGLDNPPRHLIAEPAGWPRKSEALAY
jgi:hypothetical protein